MITLPAANFKRRTIAKNALGNKVTDEEYFRSTASRPEVEVIQPGLALFPGTGIFQKGASDWQKDLERSWTTRRMSTCRKKMV
jgi:hypothetical protein